MILEAYVFLDAYADAALADKLQIDDKRGRKVAKINQISTIWLAGCFTCRQRQKIQKLSKRLLLV